MGKSRYWSGGAYERWFMLEHIAFPKAEPLAITHLTNRKPFGSTVYFGHPVPSKPDNFRTELGFFGYVRWQNDFPDDPTLPPTIRCVGVLDLTELSELYPICKEVVGTAYSDGDLVGYAGERRESIWRVSLQEIKQSEYETHLAFNTFPVVEQVCTRGRGG